METGKSKKNWVRLGIGIFIGLLCLYLASRKVNAAKMWEALKLANYWFLIAGILVLFLSHVLRAFRWRYLLDPVKRVNIGCLFSSLMIGYTGNLFIPAHLGEIMRAYVVSKKRSISMGSTFATIVIERILDIFSLLLLMFMAIFIYPFPGWVIKSGYIMFAVSMGLLILLLLTKIAPSYLMQVITFVLKPMPRIIQQKAKDTAEKFISGLLPLKHWHDYVTVGILSAFIWACYALVYYLALYAFNFTELFSLSWSASLIILVITTIAIVVPSSPGYVGTYHYICQLSLALFGIPASQALSFATVVYGVNFLPILAVGLLLAQREGISIFGMSGEVTENARQIA